MVFSILPKNECKNKTFHCNSAMISEVKDFWFVFLGELLLRFSDLKLLSQSAPTILVYQVNLIYILGLDQVQKMHLKKAVSKKQGHC